MKFKTIEIAEFENGDIEHVNALVAEYGNITDWSPEKIMKVTKEYCKKTGADLKNITNVLRVVLTGRRYHVGTQTIVYILGIEEVKNRILVLNDK